MSPELFTTTKAAVQWRATAASLLLLAGSTALAWHMAYSRASNPLSFAMAPEGWQATFRAPRDFDRTLPFRTNSAEIIRFSQRGAAEASADVLVWRVAESEALSSRSLARQILLFHAATHGAFEGPKGMFEAELPFGPGIGVELLGGEGRAVVRALATGRQTGFAVSLVVGEGPISEELYSVFDGICRSFRLPGEVGD